MSSSSSGSAEGRREQLIESHLALVRVVARRFAGRGEPLDDLVQVGAIGLIKASDRFDPSRGVAFATFATPSIEGAIRHHLRDRASSLRIPRELQRKSGELHDHTAALEAALGRSPTVRELASALEADEREVEQILTADKARKAIPISPGDEGVELSGGSEAVAVSDDRLLLAGSLRELDERERRIVLLRFHADMTERDIARELGISQAHVSRLLGGALAKLREDLSDPSADAAPGDIGAERVIPPQAEGKHAGEEPRGHGRSTSSRRKRTRGETRIRRVAASEESRTLKQRGVSLPAGESSKEKGAPSHSGRFLVRMPSELHEQLARAAEQQAVSLNRLVTDTLAASVAPEPAAEPRDPAQPSDQPADPPPPAGPAPPRLEEPDPAPPVSEQPEPAAPAEESLDPATTPPQLDRPVPIASGEAALNPRRRSGRALRVALATNLLIVVLAGFAAIVLLVIALQHGI